MLVSLAPSDQYECKYLPPAKISWSIRSEEILPPPHKSSAQLLKREPDTGSSILYTSVGFPRLGTGDKSGDSEIWKYVNASVARGDGNEGATAVNHYKKWAVGRGDVVLRPLDPLFTSLEMKKQEIVRIAHFALFLVQSQGVSASTASGYISTVNAWHSRRAMVGFAAGASLSISKAFLLGWARSHPPPRGVFQRLGITPQHLATGMDLVLGRRGECGPAAQNIRANLASAFAGLFRSCENSLQDNKPSCFQAIPQRFHLRSSPSGVFTIIVREAKRNSLKGVAPVVSTPVQFFPGGTLIDAAAELAALTRLDPAEDSAPLFRDPASGKPLKVSFIRATVKKIAAAVGLDPGFFGAHSLRCAFRVIWR